MMNAPNVPRDPRSPAWWRLPIMWLVIGGPATVVLAGVVTMWLAFDGADDAVKQVPQSRDVARSGARERSVAPAQQVRNHVATPPSGSKSGDGP